jgi:hydrogenase small subunit
MLNRREFLKRASVILASLAIPVERVEAFLDLPASQKSKVAWLQNQDCTGCSTSFLNATDLLQLITELVNIVAHPNLSFASGTEYHAIWEQVIADGGHIIIAEGSIPLKNQQTALSFGSTAAEFGKRAFASAGAIICTGTCASFGGISAAAGNRTGAVPIPYFLKSYCQWSDEQIRQKVITLPGCSVHPIEIVGTVLDVALSGKLPERNGQLSPLRFYSDLIHDHCSHRGSYEKKRFAKYPGDAGCLFEVGCKGTITHRQVCPSRKWNDGANWCIESRFGCKGCANPDFFARVDGAMFTSPENLEYIDWRALLNQGGKS